jgi:NTE family protein
MNFQSSPTSKFATRQLPFECVALVLQGGGALGAYQAGVYEALAEEHVEPDWIAGISIGGINSAIIAGNPPHMRVERLREFWTLITAEASPRWCDWIVPRGDNGRKLLNQASANIGFTIGAGGFFNARAVSPWLQPSGTMEATSFYDTAGLRGTLERLVDFDRINAGVMRLSVGAVNVRTGNFVYFDNKTHTIRPEHIMASGALPPGFPAIEIEGEYYWDGGLVSNTPLQWVLETEPRRDTLAFQVDLWNARGEFPRTMPEVLTREKEIRYSSRTRAGTAEFMLTQKLRRAAAALLEKLPSELKVTPEAELLGTVADRKVFNLVHLIYRAMDYEGYSKDYEFSRTSMNEHWRAGYNDARRTLRHPEALARPGNLDGVFTFDLSQNGRE